MKHLLLILLTWAASLHLSYAQSPKIVSGEYTYFPPSTQSIDDAKRIAMQRAQIQILADTFGTIMNVSSTTVLKNSIESSDVNLFSLSDSSVKGEWLETIGEPEYSTAITEEGMLTIRVRITGRIREITTSRAEFDIRILRNGTEDKFESTEFREGDNMFVSFKSPADGYLTIYLYDFESSVFCLLPYQQQSSVIETKGGTKYVFFSSAHDSYGIKDSLIDEYTLTCSKDTEVNRMYAIWSPESYYKPLDSMEEGYLPRMLGFKEFQKWLSKLRIQNNKVSVKTIDILIKK